MSNEKKTYGLKMPPDIEDRFLAFKNDRDIGNTEAMKRILERGLSTYGYERSPEYRTQLERASFVAALAVLCVGASWIVLSLAFGYDLFMPAGIIASLAIAPMAVSQAEPEISRRVGNWVSRRVEVKS
ncbi:MAG: hypothetical protein ACNS61_05575 [Candidatus Wenzhouxiangella sp. M2_3B_020]